MTIAVNATKEALASTYTDLGDLVSLHTADPGSTGANEATGGSPAYARQAAVWTGGASDGFSQAGQVTFDVPAGTYTHAGLWTSAGVFVDKAAITSVTMGGQGQVLITPEFQQS